MAYGCPELSTYYCNDCPKPIEGKIRAVGFALAGYIDDPSDPQEWHNMICNGYGGIIPMVNGEQNGGAPQFAAGYGAVKERLVNRTYELKYNHRYQAENVPFYNELAQSSQYEIYWIENAVSTGFSKPFYIFRSGVAATIIATDPTNADQTQTKEFMVTAKWDTIDMPTPTLLATVGSSKMWQSCLLKGEVLGCLVCQPVVLYNCGT